MSVWISPSFVFNVSVCMVGLVVVSVRRLSQRSFPSVDHLAASAAHVVHYGFTPAGAGAKNSLLRELVLATFSVAFGLPLGLPVFT